jgi:hypothetical protein
MTTKFLASALLVWLFAHPAKAQSFSTTSGPAPVSPAATATRPFASESVTDGPNDQTRQQARGRFEIGMKLYEEGDYSLALLEFERAHSLVPEYRVLYNIGQVNIQLGRYARAVTKLRQYLAQGGDLIPMDRKASVLSDLDMLAARTATILVTVNVTGAEIVLDNDIVATSPMQEPALIDAGEHRLTIRKPSYQAQTRPIALVGRDQASIEFRLTEEPKLVTTERTVIVERPSAQVTNPAIAKRNLWLTIGWSGTGLFATAWATTGYLGYSTARKRQTKLNEATSAEELSALKSNAKNWYIAADICGGLTLAATATMVYYTFFTPRPAGMPVHAAMTLSNLNIGLSPGRVLVTGQF